MKILRKILLCICLFGSIGFVSSCSLFDKQITNNPSDSQDKEKLPVPQNIRLDNDEIVWNYIDNVTKYGVLINDTDYYETNSNRYKLTKSYSGYVKIRSLSTSTNYSNSEYSEAINFTYNMNVSVKKLDMPTTKYSFVTNDSAYTGNKANINKYSWNKVENATGYQVSITSKDGTVNIDDYVTTTEYNIVLFKNHTITIKVKAVSENYSDSDWLVDSGLDYVPLEKHLKIKTLFDKGLGAAIDLSSSVDNPYHYESISPFSIDKLANYINVNENVTSGQGKYEIYESYTKLTEETKNTISAGLDVKFPIKIVNVSVGGKYTFDKQSITEKSYGQIYYSYHDYMQVAQGTIDYSNKKLLAACLNDGLINEFKKIDSTSKAKIFFNTYGTHFIADAAYGGAIDVVYCAYDIKSGSYTTVKNQLDATLKVGFKNIGVQVSGSWDNVNTNSSLNSLCSDKFMASYVGGQNRDINTPNNFFKMTYNWKQSVQNFETTISNPNFAMIGVKKYISLISILEELKDQYPSQYSYLSNYYASICQ